MEIKTIQGWIEYAECIDESCYGGEDVYQDIRLVKVDGVLKILDDDSITDFQDLRDTLKEQLKPKE